MSIAKLLITLSVIFAVCFLCVVVESRQDPLASCPRRMLWVWERPEDLSWLDSSKFGVAYLDRTIFLSGDSVHVVNRKQPMTIPTGTYVMSVVRLESNRRNPATFTDKQIAAVTQSVLAAGKNEACKSMQIDFDARQSEQPAYKRLLTAVRSSMPGRISLSMTALVSWCVDENWLAELPVDEAVPMFFRMGVHNGERTRYLQDLTSAASMAHRMRCKCSDAIGVSVDELTDLKPLSARRVYIFSPSRWQESSTVALTNQTRFQ
jgi:hypothetical protein